MDLPSVLMKLSETCGVRESQPAAKAILEELSALGIEAAPDTAGNLAARCGCRDAGATNILLEAHYDEIAFIVTDITPDGFLRVGKVGGPDLRVLAGHEVTVFGKEPMFGVFCCRPPHLTGEEERKKAIPIDEAAVDIGFDHDKAASLVEPGDFVFLRRKPMELAPGIITGKALDNRAGCAVVLRTLEKLQKVSLACTVSAVFALGEELGERGIVPGAFAAAPDEALIVDTSFALTQDSPEEKCGHMGEGPMVGHSPILDAGLTQAVCVAADAAGIRFQHEIMSGRTGTDADAAAVTRGGVRTALLSVPLRYMHTANEVVAVSDVEATADVLASYLLANYGAKEAERHA